MKRSICSPHIQALLDFSRPFKVQCDASGKGIGAVLIQEGLLIVYFSEKLGGGKLNYST